MPLPKKKLKKAAAMWIIGQVKGSMGGMDVICENSVNDEFMRQCEIIIESLAIKYGVGNKNYANLTECFKISGIK